MHSQRRNINELKQYVLMWGIFREQGTSSKWWAGTNGSTWSWWIEQYTFHHGFVIKRATAQLKKWRSHIWHFTHQNHPNCPEVTEVGRIVLEQGVCLLGNCCNDIFCIEVDHNWSMFTFNPVLQDGHTSFIPTCFMTPLAMTADVGHVGAGHSADLMVFENGWDLPFLGVIVCWLVVSNILYFP